MSPSAPLSPPAPLGAFREVPFMGVIFVVHEAAKRGFSNGHPDWCNLGQGQPEIGPMAGAPKRLASVEIKPEDCAYGPLGGTDEFRATVAGYYNRLYRAGKKSQFTAANVCGAQGGRLALTRVMAALGHVNIGYILPDYTAYEDMFDLHHSRLHPVPIRGNPADGFTFTAKMLLAAIDAHGLTALLLSNPCNPTGGVIQGAELKRLVDGCRARGTTLILDEFYSHYIYTRAGKPGRGPVSAAPFLADIERDNVLLVDGLTKNHRYPGFRIGWVLGPSAMMETLSRTASSIDGGPSRLAQRAALAALEPARADEETAAVRVEFAKKRNLMLKRLRALGVRFPRPSESTFYLWGSLENLPAPLNDAMTFFWRALDHKVMTVPGQFFDVNPGKRRKGASPYSQWMRFSFGPPMGNVRLGLDRLEAMVRAAK
ncbi:MAG: pyridoxal phosphate-dependent aminotransferase [Opitutae bacterium]|nr:pyridoxal phosphate-dependent aminotransferase [Opitutae bacterium]